jgi:hypothetical protein
MYRGGEEEEMPNTNPPNGTYTSTDDVNGGTLASWNGSFTYNGSADKEITYTRTSPSKTFDAVKNKSQGNAIVFSLTDNSVSPAVTVHFDLATPGSKNGKATYTGNCNNNSPDADQDGWTATQN